MVVVVVDVDLLFVFIPVAFMIEEFNDLTSSKTVF